MDQPPSTRSITVRPEGSADWVTQAVIDGGAAVVEPADATAVVWTNARDSAGLGALLAGNPQLEWVQVPFAGIENFVPIVTDERT